MPEIISSKPSNFDRAVEKKVFSSDFVFRNQLLEDFIKACGDYKGPFTKSIFIQHNELVNRCAAIGVELYRNRMDKKYYIVKPKEDIEPILFDPNLLDIENESKETDIRKS